MFLFSNHSVLFFLFTLIWVLEVFFSCNDSSSPTYFPYWDYNFANFENNQLKLETDWTEQENNSVLFQRRDHVSAEGFRQIFSIITFAFLSVLTLSFHFFCSLSVRLLVIFLILHFRKSFVCISYSYVCRLFISIFFLLRVLPFSFLFRNKCAKNISTLQIFRTQNSPNRKDKRVIEP